MYELSDTKRARQTDRQTNSIRYNWWGCVLESVNVDCFGCLGLRLSLPREFLAHAPIYLVQNIATTPHHQKIKLYVPGYTGNPAHVPVTGTPVIPGKFGQVCIFLVGQDILYGGPYLPRQNLLFHGKTYFSAAKLTFPRQNLLFHGKTYFLTAKRTFPRQNLLYFVLTSGF